MWAWNFCAAWRMSPANSRSPSPWPTTSKRSGQRLATRYWTSASASIARLGSKWRMLARQSSARSRSSAAPVLKIVAAAGLGKACDRQQLRCGEIRHDQTDALRREVAEGCGDIAVLRGDAFDEFEGLAGKMPGRIVVGDAEPRALYSFILRRLIEIGERQGPLDRLRQPADLHRLPVGVDAAVRRSGYSDYYR